MALDRNTVPIGGWQYVQLDPNGSPVRGFRQFGTFTMFCQDILACRRGNNLPRATQAEVEADVEAATCARVPSACGQGAPVPPNEPRSVGSCVGCG
jgi:hypothetical protein